MKQFAKAGNFSSKSVRTAFPSLHTLLYSLCTCWALTSGQVLETTVVNKSSVCAWSFHSVTMLQRMPRSQPNRSRWGVTHEVRTHTCTHIHTLAHTCTQSPLWPFSPYRVNSRWCSDHPPTIQWDLTPSDSWWMIFADSSDVIFLPAPLLPVLPLPTLQV